MLLQVGVFHKHPRNNTSRQSYTHAFWLVFLLCVSALSLSPQDAWAKQAWLHNNLALAKQHAAGQRPLLVQVSAGWCTPCNQLHHEVLDTPAGHALLKHAVGVRFDFETPAGQRATKRFTILNLPTTVLIDVKGQEIGRIEGYPGRKEYLQRLHELLRGHGDFEKLQQLQKKRALKDPEKLQWARALLVRSRHQEAYKVLQPMLFQPSRLGQDATRMWGRWLLRVQKRTQAAEAHFRKAAETYKSTPAYAGFLYWQANSLHQQGRTQEATQLFLLWKSRASKKFRPTMLLADFLVHHRLDPKKTQETIRQSFQLLPAKSKRYQRYAPWLLYLSAQVEQRQGHPQAAQKLIQRAIKMSPRTAIYQNFARQLSASPAQKQP
ncbi:MAG: tetratricopeptide repeat protein [Myxococcales bacterium]|nr:tetratricopeptide repeat protein [Myxococcales bacterium]